MFLLSIATGDNLLNLPTRRVQTTSQSRMELSRYCSSKTGWLNPQLSRRQQFSFGPHIAQRTNNIYRMQNNKHSCVKVLVLLVQKETQTRPPGDKPIFRLGLSKLELILTWDVILDPGVLDASL